MKTEEEPYLSGSPRIRLPQLRRLSLTDFSLYENSPNVQTEFGRGVFCLAGANGLGKSTFLAAIGFALTGVVADPQQKMASLDEFYNESIDFSKDYFTGRIDTTDRPTAAVTLEFRLGGADIQLTRGMFEPLSLRRLVIQEAGGPEVVQTADDDDQDGTFCSGTPRLRGKLSTWHSV